MLLVVSQYLVFISEFPNLIFNIHNVDTVFYMCVLSCAWHGEVYTMRGLKHIFGSELSVKDYVFWGDSNRKMLIRRDQ